MPELNDAITKWRHRMSAEEAVTPPLLDELTDHLDTELARLPAEGLTPEERVLIAARRVGAPDTLGREFLEVRAGGVWTRRLYWAVLGWLMIALPAKIAGLTGGLTLFLTLQIAPDLGSAGTVAGLIAGGTALALWVLWLGWILRDLTGKSARGSVATTLETRPGLVLIGAALLTLGLAAGGPLTQALTARAGGVTTQHFGQFAVVAAIGQMVVALLVPLVLVLITWRRIQRTA